MSWKVARSPRQTREASPNPHASPHLRAGETPVCSECHHVHRLSDISCSSCHGEFQFSVKRACRSPFSERHLC
ncbi:cytochrome c3 family protein [Bradyrhizobium quebecense]|uniref:cytochrome c3 family protein n=1 Tax=Bradyrhizobium quebecense TaxID=2748629 RepID=UPI003B84ABA6